MHAIPIMLQSREILGCAPTGLNFILLLLTYVLRCYTQEIMHMVVRYSPVPKSDVNISEFYLLRLSNHTLRVR